MISKIVDNEYKIENYYICIRRTFLTVTRVANVYLYVTINDKEKFLISGIINPNFELEIINNNIFNSVPPKIKSSLNKIIKLHFGSFS